MILVLFGILTAVIPVVVGLVAIGSVVARQRHIAPPVVYDLNQAVEFVAERLPEEMTARVSYAQVEQVLTAKLSVLARDSAVTFGIENDEAAELTVTAEDELLAELLDRGENWELSDTDIAEILLRDQEYLREIGAVDVAISPEVDLDDT